MTVGVGFGTVMPCAQLVLQTLAGRTRLGAAAATVSLSRSVGALAHAFEEMQSGERNKGPIPRNLIWTYTGPPARKLAADRRSGST